MSGHASARSRTLSFLVIIVMAVPWPAGCGSSVDGAGGIGGSDTQVDDGGVGGDTDSGSTGGTGTGGVGGTGVGGMDGNGFVTNDYSLVDGAPASTPTCTGVGEQCVSNSGCCGYPELLGCARVVQGLRCVSSCDTNSDCQSGCCQWREGLPGKGICVPAEGSCLPSAPGPNETSVDTVDGVQGMVCTLPNDPCDNNIDCCGYSDAERTGGCATSVGIGKVCHATCTTSEECESGCCVPLQGSLQAVCRPYDPYCL